MEPRQPPGPASEAASEAAAAGAGETVAAGEVVGTVVDSGAATFEDNDRPPKLRSIEWISNS